MVEMAYGSILGSKPYLFLVGPQKREFFVHASLAAGQSAVLDALVNGSMQEATEGCTVWEGVDEDTFVRFGQYVYTGNYEGSVPFEPPAVEEPAPELDAEQPAPELFAEEPAPVLEAEIPAPEPVDASGPAEEPSGTDRPAEEPEVAKEDSPAEAPCEPKPEPADAGFWSAPPRSAEKKKKKKSKILLDQDISMDFSSELDEFKTVAPPLTRDDAWKSFEEKQYEAGGDNANYSVPPNPKNRRIVYEQVFLEHARVHMMAYYYDMQPLAQLALFKLHRALCTFTLHDERMGDVVGLLRYCYREDDRPLLRAMVSEYAACHVKQLWADAEFRELFGEHGEMSVAIMGCIMERLH
ncbi:hypothetical protein ACQRIU_005061 [Beauveria bassiana]